MSFAGIEKTKKRLTSCRKKRAVAEAEAGRGALTGQIIDEERYPPQPWEAQPSPTRLPARLPSI